MYDVRLRRNAFSILEFLVAMAIVGVLMGMIISAVQKIRAKSAELQTRNSLRQFVVAYQNWDERKPRSSPTGLPGDSFGGGVFFPIRQYLDVPQPWDGKYFLSATDPSAPSHVDVDRGDRLPGVVYTIEPVGDCSFGFNSVLQRQCPRLSDVSDGTSRTVLLSERYATCKTGDRLTDTFVSWSLNGNVTKNATTGEVIPNEGGSRRATFADEMYLDIRPQTSGQPASTVGIPENIAFQTRPPLNACDPRVVQGSTTGGLLVGMADGHVRLLHRSMAPNVFWALVTPRGGESLPD